MHKNLFIWEALSRIRRARMGFFNTPGHMEGRLYGRPSVDLRLFRYDFTELAGVPENLSPPVQVAKAEEKAAHFGGAEWCRFLYNGATAGVEAMFLGTLRSGDRVLLPRHVHFSVITGLLLSGAEPVFLYPKVESFWQIPVGIPLERWAAALEENKGLKAVFITNPSYQGLCFPLREIITLAHQQNLPVLVDEAHGGLLSLAGDYPHSAQKAGADLWVQSMHKNLGGPNQTGILYGRGARTEPGLQQAVTTMLQSSSPSYPLLAGLEQAVAFAAAQGELLFKKARDNAWGFKCDIMKKNPALRILSEKPGDLEGVASIDPTRVFLSGRDISLCGEEIARRLAKQRLLAEYYEGFNILFLFNAALKKRECRKLGHTLSLLTAPEDRKRVSAENIWPGWGPCRITPRQAFFSAKSVLPIRECAGRIAAQVVFVYPPGTPVLIPGERISEEMISFIERLPGGNLVMMPQTSEGRLLVVND